MGSASNEEREVRAARNQALFRAVNEKIMELNDGFGEIVGGTVSVACECSQVECVRLLEITSDAYQAVRESPRTFVVLVDHVEPGVERIVSAHDGYAVVEVQGQGGRVADATFRSGRTTPASG